MNIMWSSVHKSNSLGHSESSQYVQKSSCLLLDRTHVDKIVEQGVDGKAGYGLDSGLTGYVFPMGYYSVNRKAQFISDFLVQHSLGHTDQDLFLTG